MLARIGVAAYSAGWAIVRRLPDRGAYGLFRLLADLAWRRRGPRIRQYEANLRRVVPGADEAELRRVSRAGLRSYSRYWCDVFRLPDWTEQEMSARLRVRGEHWLRAPGFIGALAHMGNWDHAGAWSCVTGTPVTTVVERLRPEAVYERFLAFREGLGMQALPHTGAGRDLMRGLADAVRDERAVCLVADRDLTDTGVEVTFFGESTRMPAGPAVLALTTGARLHPVTSFYDGPVMVLEMHPPVEVPASGPTRAKAAAMMQDVATVFELTIREHPADWHMLQPFWAADRRAASAPSGSAP